MAADAVSFAASPESFPIAVKRSRQSANRRAGERVETELKYENPSRPWWFSRGKKQRGLAAGPDGVHHSIASAATGLP